MPTLTAAQSAFASSPAGGVLWTSAVLTQGANTATPGVITAARLTLLLADENTANLPRFPRSIHRRTSTSSSMRRASRQARWW